MADSMSLTFSLNKAKRTSVVLTGTRGDAFGTSTAVLTLTPPSGMAVTYTATLTSDSGGDFEITGLAADTTYAITGTGDFNPNTSITEVTTLTDDPRVALESQWEDLADRIKAKADASTVSGKLDNTTTFWGQTVNNGHVGGNIDLGNASTGRPITVGLTDDGAKIDFGHDNPDNGRDFISLSVTNSNTGKSAALGLVAANDAYISSNAPLGMGGKQINNLANGTASTDAVTKGQMDTAISGVQADWSVRSSLAAGYVKNVPEALRTVFGSGTAASPWAVLSDEVRGDGDASADYIRTVTTNSSYDITEAYAGVYIHDVDTIAQEEKRLAFYSDLEDRILAGGTSAPTTSTVGKVGTLYAYVESGAGHLAICTAVSGSTYTWQVLV